MRILLLALTLVAPLFAAEPNKNVTTTPADRFEQEWWKPRHEQKMAQAKEGGHQIVFVGDSITQGWEGHGKELWQKYYAPRKALNLGFSGDRTENVLWRLENGELENVDPKLYVVMIGTNNTGHRQDPAEQTAEGVKQILKKLMQHSPNAQILLLAVFPREANPDGKLRQINDDINARIAKLAAAKNVHWLDINDQFLEADGTLPKEIMPDLLHPQGAGYFLWAKAMEPEIKKLLGE